jgi:hypothetical protein
MACLRFELIALRWHGNEARSPVANSSIYEKGEDEVFRRRHGYDNSVRVGALESRNPLVWLAKRVLQRCH